MNTQSHYIQALRAKEMGLIHVPKKEKNHTICLCAVNVNGLDIYHVPKKLRSETVCFSAVYQNPEAIKLFDEPTLRSQPLLLEVAVSRQGKLLLWIKETLPDCINQAICLSSVKASGMMLGHIPDEFLTNEMVKTAVANDASFLNALYLTQNPQVHSVIDSVLGEIPLKHLPESYMSYDVCIQQVSIQGRQLRYVPLSLIDEKMIKASLDQNPWSIEFVPVTFSDYHFIKEFIERRIVPESLYYHLIAEPEFF